jgi:hypothetical protein
MVPRRRVDRTMAMSLQHGQTAQLFGLQAVSRTVVLACCSCPLINSAQRRIQPLQRVECLLMAISGPKVAPRLTSAFNPKRTFIRQAQLCESASPGGKEIGMNYQVVLESRVL